jgi:hypothetical protein
MFEQPKTNYDRAILDNETGVNSTPTPNIVQPIFGLGAAAYDDSRSWATGGDSCARICQTKLKQMLLAKTSRLG